MDFSNTLTENQNLHIENTEEMIDDIHTTEPDENEIETSFSMTGFDVVEESLIKEINEIEEIDSIEMSVQPEVLPTYKLETFSNNEISAFEKPQHPGITNLEQNFQVDSETFKNTEITENDSFDIEHLNDDYFEAQSEEISLPEKNEFLEKQISNETSITSEVTANIEVNKGSETPEFDAFFSELLEESFFDDSQKSNKEETNDHVNNVELNDSPNNLDVPENDNDWAEYAETVGQIGSIKTLDQIFFGIERDQLKIQIKPFDSLALNMALQEFRKGNLAAKEQVFDEILKWQDYLLERDENIGLKDLRIHCETAKPALNSKALLTLGEFYQNVSRTKFEMLLTRVFSKLTENAQRRLIVETADIEQHIVNIFSKNDQQSEDQNARNEVILKLQHFRTQASECESFSGMLAIELITLYNHYKKELGPEFNDSKILTYIIESNVIIGNRFIKLLVREKSSPGNIDFEDKNRFGVKFEDEVSETFCQTILLDNIVAEVIVKPVKKVQKQTESVKQKTEARKQRLDAAEKQGESSTAKLIIYAVITCVITFVILYVSVTYLMDYGLAE